MASKKIALIAGEASGDQLGALLMQALRARDPDLVFIGVGGQAMQAQGLASLFPMSELSILGIAGIVRDLPNLWRRLKQTVAYFKKENPDVVVSIDAPEFGLRVARKLVGTGIQRVHYVAPTVWAWRPGRAKKIARFLDHLLAIYPFEPPYFLPHGLATTFVGHGVVEKGIVDADPAWVRDKYQLTHQKVLTLMPGSRRTEVEALLPIFQEAAALCMQEDPTLKVFIPVAPTVRTRVEQILQDWDVPVQLVHEEAEKYALMRASTAILAASGTVNLELAIAQVPFVIAYRVPPLTGWLAKRLLRVRYVTMVNIIANQKIVPELLQEACTPLALYQALTPLLHDASARARMRKNLEEAVCQLLPASGNLPSQQAAEVILSLMNPAVEGATA